MTTEELEQLLEAGAESPRLDYKGPCKWNVNTFAKDILAMVNTEDGGSILIGMAEDRNGYKRVGLNEEELASFKYDDMRDQFSKFAEPLVDFTVYSQTDRDGKVYIVIRISEFREIPVICVKPSQSASVIAPALYYRNTDKKVESGLISNYHDLRNLMERSATKIKRRWEDLGLKASDDFQERLAEELKEIK